MDFVHDMTYLMHFFQRIYGGKSMEWFSKIPYNIKNFDQLASIFIAQYSYNIKREATMIDFCNTKQLPNESLRPSYNDRDTSSPRIIETYQKKRRLKSSSIVSPNQ